MHLHNQEQQTQLQQQHLPYCYVRPPAGNNDQLDTLSVATNTTTTTTTGAADAQPAHSLGCSLLSPIMLCLLLMLLYVAMGTLCMALLEQWTLIEGLYFCFMTLSTIGFCDLLPGASAAGRGDETISQLSLWFCSFYILSGLTLTSMCVNLVHEEINNHLRVVVKFKKTTTASSRSGRKDSQRDKERNYYAAPP